MEQLLQFARNSKQIQVIGLTVNAENVRATVCISAMAFKRSGVIPAFSI